MKRITAMLRSRCSPSTRTQSPLLFSDVDMPGDTNGFALAHHVAENYPWIEIVIGSGHLRPRAGDLPEKATFVSKPFNPRMIHGHLRQSLPDDKLPEPLKKAV
jgi:DNA-binding NtrC family response regulator